jgi:hypothetical protein
MLAIDTQFIPLLCRTLMSAEPSANSTCESGLELTMHELGKMATAFDMPLEAMDLGQECGLLVDSGRSQMLRKRIGQPWPPNPNGPWLVFWVYAGTIRWPVSP